MFVSWQPCPFTHLLRQKRQYLSDNGVEPLCDLRLKQTPQHIICMLNKSRLSHKIMTYNTLKYKFTYWFDFLNGYLQQMSLGMMGNSKGIPRQAEVALGVLGRLRRRIFSTSGTTRVVGRQPNAPAAFTPGEIPGTQFSEAESTSGPMVLSEGTTEKIPSDTTGDRSRDRPTSSAAP